MTGFYPQPDKPRATPKEQRRQIAAKSKRESSRLVDEADRLAKAELIKRVGLRCQACGATRGQIDRAHGFGKKAHPSIRFARANLVLLCRACHEAWGRTLPRWLEFLERLLGSETFARLVETGRRPRRPLVEIVAGLKAGKFSDELERA